MLVRKESLDQSSPSSREAWGADDKRVIARPRRSRASRSSASSAADLRKLKGKVDHFFHLAAIYDLQASADDQQAANVDGTRNAVEFATAIAAGCFHHVSSIAAAGLYEGVVPRGHVRGGRGARPSVFPHQARRRGVVRRECKRPFRIYRPGFVVGDSKTGQIDKIDGPYYFFKSIQKMREILPPWMPTIGIEGGRINIVPVDFVADALDYLAHKKGLDGQCFHLTDPEPHRIGEVLNIFAKAAHAPQMTMRINAKMFGFIPAPILYGLGSLAPVKRAMRVVLTDLGIPRDVFQFVNWPTRYDNREAAKALKGSGIVGADARHRTRRSSGTTGSATSIPTSSSTARSPAACEDKVVVVTGASSGIGQRHGAEARRGGRASVMLVARGEEKLARNEARDRRDGRQALVIYTADISDLAVLRRARRSACSQEHGGCDYLVNNAGRSIRRGVINSFDRFHDFERTMQLNYFGAMRLIMGSCPG